MNLYLTIGSLSSLLFFFHPASLSIPLLSLKPLRLFFAHHNIVVEEIAVEAVWT
jgi:hypothetical protein